MSPNTSSTHLRRLLSSLRAAHRRSGDEWVRHFETPATPAPRHPRPLA